MKHLCALVLLLTACRGQSVTVLDLPDASVPPIDSCERAFSEGITGAPCEGLEMGCFRERGCCIDEAYCDAGRLFLFDDRCDACGRCGRDEDCAPGQICLGGAGMCVECPGPFPGECPPCPPELVAVIRNGCNTCECIPPTQCHVDEECGDPSVWRCARGLVCVCENPETCCANACAAVTCRAMGPPPEGCVVPCADPACPTGLCRNARCTCDADRWVCEHECAFEPFPMCPPP